MIYFAMLPNGVIKIGFTNNLKQRIGALSQCYGGKVEILHTAEGGKPEEAEMHCRFSNLRFPHTEQFLPGKRLMDFLCLDSPTTMPAGPLAGEKLTSMRLTEDDLMVIDELASCLAMPGAKASRSAAVRIAARQALARLRAEKKTSKKSVHTD